MRKDMHKVIIDLPRVGGGDKPFKEKRCELEDLPKKESMRKKWKTHWSGKEFSDRLGPLRRWLDKQVGRPWNDVYSEICEHNDKRSTSQSHLIDHIEREITRHVEYIDGKVFLRNLQRFELRLGELFVCPETGKLLKYNKEDTRPLFDAEQVDRLINKRDGYECLEKIKGIWYYCNYRRNTIIESRFDETTGRYLYRKVEKYGTNTYNCEYIQHYKRQLNKKELKRLNEYLAKLAKDYKGVRGYFWYTSTWNSLYVPDGWLNYIMRSADSVRLAA